MLFCHWLLVYHLQRSDFSTDGPVTTCLLAQNLKKKLAPDNFPTCTNPNFNSQITERLNILWSIHVQNISQKPGMSWYLKITSERILCSTLLSCCIRQCLSKDTKMQLGGSKVKKNPTFSKSVLKGKQAASHLFSLQRYKMCKSGARNERVNFFLCFTINLF